MQNSDEEEANLNNTIRNLQHGLDEQQERFDDAGNPDIDALKKLEGFMKNKFDQVVRTIKESLLNP